MPPTHQGLPNKTISPKAKPTGKSDAAASRRRDEQYVLNGKVQVIANVISSKDTGEVLHPIRSSGKRPAHS